MSGTEQRWFYVSTHSRPKAAGNYHPLEVILSLVSTHSRPKAAGVLVSMTPFRTVFQHTAARRRLGKRTYERILF